MIAPLEIDCNSDFSYQQFEQARKIKIIGWMDPKASRQHFGALRLAQERNGKLNLRR